MQSADEVRMAAKAGASAVGLVAAMPGGPGPISDALIAKIAREVPAGISSFLLSSETSAEELAAHLARSGCSHLQVVRHIDPAESERLATMVGAGRIVQVVHVESADALDLIDVYAPHVGAFLLDSGRPSANELGGTGRRHDWAISAQFVQRSPRAVWLAGGLGPGNAAEAIAAVRPFGLDLCSGLRPAVALDAGLLGAFAGAVLASGGQGSALHPAGK